MAAVRYNADGSLDNSFDGDGIVITNFGGLNVEAKSVAIQTDGKILLGATTYADYSDFTLIRYQSDGSLDNSFDRDGKLTTSI